MKRSILHDIRMTCANTGVSCPQEQLTIYYLRLCGEYLDRSVQLTNNSVMAGDMINLLHDEAMSNEFVDAHVICAFEERVGGLWEHIEYNNLDRLIQAYPEPIFGLRAFHTWDDLIEAHRRLYSDE